MDTPEPLNARLDRLKAEVAHHKSEIRRHRDLLRQAAINLARETAHCRALADQLTASLPAGEEGVLHGRTDSQSRYAR